MKNSFKFLVLSSILLGSTAGVFALENNKLPDPTDQDTKNQGSYDALPTEENFIETGEVGEEESFDIQPQEQEEPKEVLLTRELSSSEPELQQNLGQNSEEEEKEEDVSSQEELSPKNVEQKILGEEDYTHAKNLLKGLFREQEIKSPTQAAHLLSEKQRENLKEKSFIEQYRIPQSQKAKEETQKEIEGLNKHISLLSENGKDDLTLLLKEKEERLQKLEKFDQEIKELSEKLKKINEDKKIGEEIIDHLQKSFALGFSKSSLFLGKFFLESYKDNKKEENKTKGLLFLETALLQGNKKAAIHLSYLYKNGIFVPKNVDLSNSYREKAHHLGNLTEKQTGKLTQEIPQEETLSDAFYKLGKKLSKEASTKAGKVNKVANEVRNLVKESGVEDKIKEGVGEVQKLFGKAGEFLGRILLEETPSPSDLGDTKEPLVTTEEEKKENTSLKGENNTNNTKEETPTEETGETNSSPKKGQSWLSWLSGSEE